jgi:alpha,alpha-trehalase
MRMPFSPWIWKTLFGLALAGLAGTPAPPAAAQDDSAALQPPDVLFGQLYADVEKAQLFPDQKTFADAVPRRDPATILADYRAQKGQGGFDLAAFVAANFTLPDDSDTYVPPPGQTLRQHIDGLWTALTRETTSAPPHASLLPLPRPYVVPGGRFREAYYWDTYFTMLGLGESGRWDLVEDMVENFAHELDVYGHIPNGNRTYYLSRSQPPFFAFMLDLLASHEGDGVYLRYLPQLKEEYAYWMDGADRLARGQAAGRVLRLDDGSLLNRYWDERDVPRTESYLDDLTTAGQAAGRPAAEVYRDLRAAAASGWDFSSRWLGDGHSLASVRTTAIAPVDLNSLLYHLEATLARASALDRDVGGTVDYALRAARRAQAINRHLWNDKGYYADYDWQRRRLSDQVTAAALYPLFAEAALPDRAWRTARTVRARLLKQGGLVTTTVDTGQQWDAPNGWAPLQWIAVQGLRKYGQKGLAQDIAVRFLGNVQALYDSEQKLVEKYVVEGEGIGGGGGGEYPLQDGFGWTNGVTLKLLDLYPCAATGCAPAQDQAVAP